MISIKPLLASLVLILAGLSVYAQDYHDESRETGFFAGFNAGGALAFGDDSYNIISDFSNANGTSVSAFFGKDFSKVFSTRVNLRYSRLYSRVNLETLSMRDIYPDKYGDLFPRDGFYGYNCYGLQIDAMFNPINYVPKRAVDIFNLYLLGSVGANMINGYSNYVKEWSRVSETLDAGWYEVDTKTHIMPTVMIGGILDFKLCKFLHLDFQLDCTFTGDNLEGVISQEFYDAYITYSVGLTAHF